MQILVRDRLVIGAAGGRRFNPQRNRIISVVDFLREFFTDSEKVLDARPSNTHALLWNSLRSADGRGKPLREMFASARMYFSHFIKVRNWEQMSRQYLLRLAARGASIYCSNSSPGIDILTPFFFWDTSLNEWNVSVIIWRVENDERYQTTPKQRLFDAMNPYSLEIFSDEDAENECAEPESGASPQESDEKRCYAPLPVIRIVNALAAREPGLVNFQYADETTSDRSGLRRCTSYDFWVHGSDKSVYRAMGYPLAKLSFGADLTESQAWKDLLDASVSDERVFTSVHNGPRHKLRREEYPGGYAHNLHYRWFPLDEDAEMETE